MYVLIVLVIFQHQKGVIILGIPKLVIPIGEKKKNLTDTQRLLDILGHTNRRREMGSGRPLGGLIRKGLR